MLLMNSWWVSRVGAVQRVEYNGPVLGLQFGSGDNEVWGTKMRSVPCEHNLCGARSELHPEPKRGEILPNIKRNNSGIVQ